MKVACKRIVFGLGIVVLYGSIVLWCTWPSFPTATTKIAIGTSETVTVPLFNVWTIWWNSDQARHGFESYWDAPIFFPTQASFAFSEPQPMTQLVAPLVWLFDSRSLAYNTYLWISLLFNGLMTFRLLRESSLGRYSCVVGGATMILLPIVHWQSDVLQLVPLWGILWTFSALLRVVRVPTVIRGSELGVAFAAAFFCSVHHALFLAILLGGSMWITADRWREIRWWRSILMAVLIGGGLTVPFVLTLRTAMAANEFERTEDQLERLSLEPGDYTAPYGQVWLDAGNVAARASWHLGVGKLVSLLALIGIAFGIRRRRWRRSTLLFLSIGVLGVLLSFGLDLKLGGWQPWRTLSSIIPGLTQVRNVFRFAYFVQIALVLLAAQGFYALWLWKSAWIGRVRGRIVFFVLGVILGFLTVFEVRPYRTRLATPPDVHGHLDWIAFVREQTPQGSSIACLPFAPGNLVQDFDSTVRWMYFGTYHRVPMVNGYSGFFPQSYFDLRDLVNKRFPEQIVFDRLREAGATFLVIDTEAYSSEVIEQILQNETLEFVFESPTGIVVFRLVELVE